MTSCRVRVPATSANLGPGFDAFGLALGLYNEIRIAPRTAAQPAVVVHSADAGVLPTGPENIAWVAAHRLLQQLGHGESEFCLEMWNQIPLSRGLGSSAAARVGALVAANAWAEAQQWPTADSSQLLDLATELEGHPDNAAAALLGGFVTSLTNGASGDSSAHALKIPVSRYPAFLVWSPDEELATKAARAVLPELVPHRDAVFNLSRAAMLVAALVSGELAALRDALQDRLHQPQRAALVPGWDVLKAAGEAAGAYGMTLSGAGSSLLFWLPPDDATALAAAEKTICEAAARAALSGHLRALPVDSGGAMLIEDAD